MSYTCKICNSGIVGDPMGGIEVCSLCRKELYYTDSYNCYCKDRKRRESDKKLKDAIDVIVKWMRE
jgi:hypothetical protein